MEAIKDNYKNSSSDDWEDSDTMYQSGRYIFTFERYNQKVLERYNQKGEGTSK